jgi:hypothetical protein
MIKMLLYRTAGISPSFRTLCLALLMVPMKSRASRLGMPDILEICDHLLAKVLPAVPSLSKLTVGGAQELPQRSM